MPHTETKNANGKTSLRKAMRAVLSNLDRRWVKAASPRVCQNLAQYVKGLANVDHVLAWSSFFDGEVDLTVFVEAQLQEGRRVYLPQTSPNSSMQFMAVNEGWRQSAVPGIGGILEPYSETGVLFDAHTSSSALVVVPGLAFDERGGRLGRGFGFYDRFLARSLMRPAHVIGAGWELQMIPEVPMSAHDQALAAIVTEERLVPCTD